MNKGYTEGMGTSELSFFQHGGCCCTSSTGRIAHQPIPVGRNIFLFLLKYLMDSFHHLCQLLCIGLAGWVYNSKLRIHYSTFVFRIIFNFSNSTLCINNFTSRFQILFTCKYFFITLRRCLKTMSLKIKLTQFV